MLVLLLNSARPFAVAVAAAALPVGASAQQERLSQVAVVIDRNDAPERINFASKLDMHSQRIASAGCNAEAGIGGMTALGYFNASSGEFERILDALEDGDRFIGIVNPEADPRILRRVAALSELWAPIKEDATAVIQGGLSAVPEEDAAALLEAPAQLLDASRRLTSEVLGHYADPSALLTADALTIDIMGRARTMPQVLSWHACQMANGYAPPGTDEALLDDMALYGRMLDALRNGWSDAGIEAPSDPDIVAALDALDARWREVRPLFATLAGGDVPDAETRTRIFDAMNDLTAGMNDVATLQASVSKVDLGSRSN